MAIQTDYLFDRPPTPQQCFSTEGKDASTQTEPGEVSKHLM